jgi:CBS domain-containing protein
MFRVKDVMTDEVITSRADDSLESAVQIMRERGCGCVPVVDAANKVVGLVTDRDAVMCALREKKPLGDLRVSDACTHGAVCCEASDTLERAEVLMRVNHVRRLPVLGPDRVLVGVMSLTDLARHLELSESEGCTGLSPRHIAVLLAETSGVRQPPVTLEHTRSREKGPHPIIEPIFHG